MQGLKFVLINPNRLIRRGNIWNAVNSITPPLGLAILTSLLENAGHEVDLVDANALGLTTPEIISRIESDVEIIGLPSTTVEIEDVIDLAREIRRNFRNARILMGGVHPTVFHDALTAQGTCDLVIRGEGEDAILSLAERHSLESIPNLTWRTSEGKIVVNPMSGSYVDLDTLPFPAYHKLPMKNYHSALGAAKQNPSIGMITSRGCPGKCKFCYSGMYGSRIRMTSAQRVFEHILYLRNNYGIREISFYDDTFTTNKRRIVNLCDLLLSEKVNMSWSCFARVDSVNPDLLAHMKKAGCHQISFGFESADESVLKAINKRVNLDKVSNAISWTKRAGIDIRGAFMIGNPGENEESIRKTIEYSKKIGIQFAIYNISTPFPGTDLFRWAKEKGLLKHTRWGLYDLAHPVLDLPTVSSQTVQEYYHKAYREVYFRPSYILKRILSLRTKYEFKTHLSAFLGILSTSLKRKAYEQPV